jgi:hypothetical protein
MRINSMMGDEIYIQSPSGAIVGPIKSSVQGNKIFINDEKLVVEEGGKILRLLHHEKLKNP